ncbi:MAG: CDGSH iron-sulfur domain-containing protein, partial [Planctomycetes bacterium]|nr:CDGSH iron-sulfur domain-containing protein [Planctomycetota bacterium]
MVTIRLRKNGPYVVEGDDVQIVDWNGLAYKVERRPAALCRCGASASRPFCDGTHWYNDFKNDSDWAIKEQSKTAETVPESDKAKSEAESGGDG